MLRHRREGRHTCLQMPKGASKTLWQGPCRPALCARVTSPAGAQERPESELVIAGSGANSSGGLLEGEEQMADLALVTSQLLGEVMNLVASMEMIAQNHCRASLARAVHAPLRDVKEMSFMRTDCPESFFFALREELKASRRSSRAASCCGMTIRKKPRPLGKELLPQAAEMISDLACFCASGVK